VNTTEGTDRVGKQVIQDWHI